MGGQVAEKRTLRLRDRENSSRHTVDKQTFALRNRLLENKAEIFLPYFL